MPSAKACSHSLSLALILIVASALVGCVSIDETQRDLAKHWNAQGQPPWNGLHGSEAKRQFVFEGIAVKDYEYQRYVQLVRRGVSYSGFGAQTVAIGLNAAGSLTTSGTTQILSGIAGAVTGTSAAFSKNVLFDQSITTFISKMDALRLTKLAEIKDKLTPGKIRTYSFAEAYRDVEDYGHQGTLDAAFADVGKKAGQEQSEAAKSIATTEAKGTSE